MSRPSDSSPVREVAAQPGPQRGRRGGARREAIVRAGEGLLARDGYDAVNSNQIARAAGVGVGTFYRHFEDKAALVEAIRLLAWEELGRALPGPERARRHGKASCSSSQSTTGSTRPRNCTSRLQRMHADPT